MTGGLDWDCLFLESLLPANPASGGEGLGNIGADESSRLCSPERTEKVLVECCPLLAASSIAQVKQTLGPSNRLTLTARSQSVKAVLSFARLVKFRI